MKTRIIGRRKGARNGREMMKFQYLTKIWLISDTGRNHETVGVRATQLKKRATIQFQGFLISQMKKTMNLKTNIRIPTRSFRNRQVLQKPIVGISHRYRFKQARRN